MLCALTPLILGAALAAPAVPLPATLTSEPVEPPIAWFEEGSRLVPLGDEELAVQRGGFVWNGIQIGLGADLRTYLNGQLVLQTIINWTPMGSETQQFVSGALTQADAAQLQAGILTSGGITMTVGDQSVFLANQGQTAILHRTEGALQTVLVNRASNLEARQEIDAVLDLDNFGGFQQELISTRMMDNLSQMLDQSTIAGLNN